jgi:hypothetical protein
MWYAKLKRKFHSSLLQLNSVPECAQASTEFCGQGVIRFWHVSKLATIRNKVAGSYPPHPNHVIHYDIHNGVNLQKKLHFIKEKFLNEFHGLKYISFTVWVITVTF